MSTAIAAARAKTKGKKKLRDAIGNFDDEEFTLSDWMRRKKEAEEAGTWSWKAGGQCGVRAPRDEPIDAETFQLLNVGDVLNESIAELNGSGPNTNQRPNQRNSLCSWK